MADYAADLTDDDTDPKRASMTPDEKEIADTKACLQLGLEATKNQRDRANKAKAYYADAQWDPAVKRARDGTGNQDGLPPLPPRPTVTINKFKDPVRQIVNQEKDAELGVEIVAADDFEDLSPAIDDSEITLREGLVRRIQRQSDAASARSWAFQCAVISGEGWYRWLTRYVPGATSSKELYIARIYDQRTILADPAHEEPDGSDAEWIIVTSSVPWERYKSEFPKAYDGTDNALLGTSEDEFAALTDSDPAWFQTDAKNLRMCLVVERFYVARELITWCELEDGTVVDETKLPNGVTVSSDRKHVEIVKTIKWVKLDGRQVLDRTDWESSDMPFAKVVCEEIQPYDDEKRAQGIIEPGEGLQDGVNAVASKYLESFAYAPPPQLMATVEQVGPYKAMYQARTTRHLPVLFYVPVKGPAGELIPPPFVSATDVGSTIQALSMGLQMFSESVSTVVGIDSQLSHLGHTDPALKSGKAIQALQAQSAQGTSGPLHNLKRTCSYEGHAINNLLYPIYGTKPGRLVRMVNGQGETERVPIAKPSVPGATPQQGAPPQYRLTKDAKFNVIIKIAPKVTSRRQQEAATLGEIINSNPQMMGVFGDLFFKYQDGPGHQEMSERAKAMLVPQVQQLLQKESGQPDPAQLQQQLQQMGQQLKQIEGIAHAQQQELQSKRLEQDTKMKIAEMDRQTKLDLAAADRETEIAKAQIAAKSKDYQFFLEERNRVGLHSSDQAHEEAMAATQRDHEAKLAQQKLEHDAAQKDQDRKLATSKKVTKNINRGADGRAESITEESTVPDGVQ